MPTLYKGRFWPDKEELSYAIGVRLLTEKNISFAEVEKLVKPRLQKQYPSYIAAFFARWYARGVFVRAGGSLTLGPAFAEYILATKDSPIRRQAKRKSKIKAAYTGVVTPSKYTAAFKPMPVCYPSPRREGSGDRIDFSKCGAGTR